jgi:hypothetical protein
MRAMTALASESPTIERRKMTKPVTPIARDGDRKRRGVIGAQHDCSRKRDPVAALDVTEAVDEHRGRDGEREPPRMTIAEHLHAETHAARHALAAETLRRRRYGGKRSLQQSACEHADRDASHLRDRRSDVAQNDRDE